MAYTKSSKVLKYWLMPLFSSIGREIQRKNVYLGFAHICQGLFGVFRRCSRVPRGRQTIPHKHTHKWITLVQHGIQNNNNKINKNNYWWRIQQINIYHWLTTTQLRVDLSLNLFCSFFCEEKEWDFDLYLDICSSHSQTLTYTRSSH